MSDATRYETIRVLDDAMPLDLLIWRRFRTRTPGIVERTFALNPDLADAGVFVPVGTDVVIPIDAPDRSPAERTVVRLWD